MQIFLFLLFLPQALGAPTGEFGSFEYRNTNGTRFKRRSPQSDPGIVFEDRVKAAYESIANIDVQELKQSLIQPRIIGITVA